MPVDPREHAILLLHHKKLDRWLQPGGHIETDDATFVDAVLREVREETGLAARVFPPSLPVPYDIDVHEIPARPEMPAHLHLDLRVVVAASDTRIAPGDGESERVRWFSVDEALEIAGDESVCWLIEKASFYLDW